SEHSSTSAPHHPLAPLEGLFYRVAASGWISPRFFLPRVPSPAELPARTGRLHIEIVSHCWQYSHLLAYQLSSLVLHPPENTTVTMTVFHNPEDAATSSLLRFIGQHRVSH